jgi:hypothetical protein
MERCPPEILSRIFVLACADGGRTGGVLRTVSTRIAAESAPYRFWSVRVAGPRQLARFEYAVTQAAPELRRVRHLMISDSAGVDTEGFPRDFEYDDGDRLVQAARSPAFPRRQDLAGHASRWVANAIRDAEEFGQAFARTLALVAAHVQSLTLLLFTVYRPHVIAALGEVAFPRLLRMTLLFKHQLGAPDDRPATVHMPRLQLLALGSLGSTDQRWPWIHAFVASCPALDTLHLRGLSFDANTRHAVRHMLGRPPVPLAPHDPAFVEWEDGRPPAPLPRAVRCLRLREFLEDVRGGMYPVQRLRAEQEKLRDDGVASLRVRKKFLDYAQVQDEWAWMLQEEALAFASG